jgi:hypothetical protein
MRNIWLNARNRIKLRIQTAMPSAPPVKEQESESEVKKPPSKLAKWYKWFSFWRTLILSAASLYIAIDAINNDTYMALGALPLYASTIVALSLDMIFIIIRTWPGLLAICCISAVSNIPITSPKGVWAFILDRDMIMDMSTPLLNSILKGNYFWF